MISKFALLSMAGVIASFSVPGHAQGPLLVAPVLTTVPLYNYDDAPGTPDQDDPAILIHREDRRRSLVIGTAKDAGLLVYDLAGQLIQAIRPPNPPHVSEADPSTPTGVNNAADLPCFDSVSGETFGRFN